MAGKSKKKNFAQTPEQLEEIWSDKVQELFSKLNPKQQGFLLAYIDCNFSGSEAYRQSYNKLANDNTAAACASRMLRGANVNAILAHFTANNSAVFMEVDRAYRDAMKASRPVFKDGEMITEIEDHKIRIDAAQKRAQLYQLLTEKVDTTIRTPEAIKIELIDCSNPA